MDSRRCPACAASVLVKDPRQKFCNLQCSARYNNSKRERKQRRCPHCGEAVAGSTDRLCPICSETRRNFQRTSTLGRVHELASSKGHPSWRNAIVRNYNRRWNAALLRLPCHVCGYSLHVELCHIRPITDFPDTATLAEVNDPRNVIQLCPNCHWEFDHGSLHLAPHAGVEPAASI